MSTDAPRQRSHAVKTGTIPILFKQPGNCGELQQNVITALIYALAKTFSPVINFDHVIIAVPKGEVSLQYRNHRYDIAVRIGQRVILVDVLNVDAGYWQRGKEADHAEG